MAMVPVEGIEPTLLAEHDFESSKEKGMSCLVAARE